MARLDTIVRRTGKEAQSMSMAGENRLIIGISGASGVMLGVRALDACRELGVESHLVVTKAAAMTLADETDIGLAALQDRAAVVHKLSDIGASIASGSFRTLGMLVAPCSVRTMSEIATGVTVKPELCVVFTPFSTRAQLGWNFVNRVPSLSCSVSK